VDDVILVASVKPVAGTGDADTGMVVVVVVVVVAGREGNVSAAGVAGLEAA